MTRVVLAGAGRFAEEVSSIVGDASWTVEAWIEGIDASRADAAHVPPIWWAENAARQFVGASLLPAIGSPARRAFIERLVSQGLSLTTFVHPSAVIAHSALLSAGCVVFPGVVIGARSIIGVGTIVNRGALVGHHTALGSHGFVGPGANIAGGVSIGEEVRIGMGAQVRDDVSVGDGATIGMGAVVVRDVPAGAIVVGNPAHTQTSL
jgi:sugar O-acyltransferase (sialic acid O-acetyltransferase NeuD family)